MYKYFLFVFERNKRTTESEKYITKTATKKMKPYSVKQITRFLKSFNFVFNGNILVFFYYLFI
jgi:hypothetical protein